MTYPGVSTVFDLRVEGEADVHRLSCLKATPWTHHVSIEDQQAEVMRVQTAVQLLADKMIEGAQLYRQHYGDFLGWYEELPGTDDDPEQYDTIVGCNIGRAGSVLLGLGSALRLKGSNFWYAVCEALNLPDDIHVHMRDGGAPSLRGMLEQMNDSEHMTAEDTASWLRSLTAVYTATDEYGHLTFLIEPGMPVPASTHQVR